MPIYLGNTELSGVYLGSTPLSSLLVGTNTTSILPGGAAFDFTQGFTAYQAYYQVYYSVYDYDIEYYRVYRYYRYDFGLALDYGYQQVSAAYPSSFIQFYIWPNPSVIPQPYYSNLGVVPFYPGSNVYSLGRTYPTQAGYSPTYYGSSTLQYTNTYTNVDSFAQYSSWTANLEWRVDGAVEYNFKNP